MKRPVHENMSDQSVKDLQVSLVDAKAVLERAKLYSSYQSSDSALAKQLTAAIAIINNIARKLKPESIKQ